jgi:hypothetical protein
MVHQVHRSTYFNNPSIIVLNSQYIPEMMHVTSSVADPGTGAFLTPGSRKGFFRIPDPYIFESLVTFFWVKPSIIFENWPKFFSSSFEK